MPPSTQSTRRPIISVQLQIDPVVFDARLLAAVQRLLAPDRVCIHLEELDRLFSRIVQSTGGEPWLAEEAHKVISQAGVLGLTRMSNCAVELQDACRANACRAEALRKCLAAAGDIRRYAMPAARQSLADKAGTLRAG